MRRSGLDGSRAGWWRAVAAAQTKRLKVWIVASPHRSPGFRSIMERRRELQSCRRLLLLVMMVMMITEENCVNATTCVEITTPLEKVELPTQEVALFCESRTPWSTGEIAHISKCAANTIEKTHTCPGTGVASSCAGQKHPVPDSSIVNETLTVNKEAVAHYLTCTSPAAWISGAKGVLTQCMNGAWTPILDFCDDACNLPRDCSSVAELGFTTTGEFDVVLSGISMDSATRVTCQLSDEKGDSGWVVVLRFAFPVAKPAVFDNTVATGDYDNWNYFIGFNAIQDMNWNEDGTLRTLVLHMEITLESGEVYFSTFSGMELMKASFTLQNLNSVHGTAGHIMVGNVGQNPGSDVWWACPNSTACRSEMLQPLQRNITYNEQES